MSSPSGGLDSRILNDGSGNLIIGHGVNSDTPTERLRMLSGGAVLLGTTISPTSDKCSLGVAYLGNTSSGNVIELTQQTNGTGKAAAALGLAIANGGQSTNAADLFFATSLSGSLNTRMTIGSILQEPLDIHNIGTKDDRPLKVRELLNKVGLPGSAVKKYPFEFSGGQRQRIGIARALYHKPKVLVLDEATSALDNLTEKAVMEAVRNSERNITKILIAHRLSTVKNCDKIFLFDKGEIKKEGTFDELIKISDEFRKSARIS